MASYLIVVRPHQVARDEALVAHARTALGMNLEALYHERRYAVSGELDQATVERVAHLLADPVLSQAETFALDQIAPNDLGDWAIDIAYRPGVTDNEGESARLGAERARIAGVQRVRTVQRVYVQGNVDHAAVETLTRELLANELVEATLVSRPGDVAPSVQFYHSLIAPPTPQPPRIATVALRTADDTELQRISRDGVLALDLHEMQAIQAYFRTLDRDPSDGELETLAQTWSEHCSHKTFKARILYRETGRRAANDPTIPSSINGLLKTFFITETERINPPWLLSAFVDNAGIMAFGDNDAVSIKVETHNHPSALEPFGGANTGVGGVVRDILGVGGQPIANLDVLCFGPQDLPHDQLADGVLHPERIAHGVVAGVRDYGNKLGVPTVAGAVLYDEGYTYNPLVFCGTVGLAKRDQHTTGAQPGDAVVVVGGRTGRDGIHGATFSSEELTHETIETVGAAVQIGDPITEKRMIDVVLQARDQGLYRAITDCGAGGLSSAIGEMGEKTGVQVELKDVPLKYAGLQPWEIWISEAQERMVLAVPPEHLDAFLALSRAEDVEATHLGTFTDDRRLRVLYDNQPLVDLGMAFVHDGRPQRVMEAVWTAHDFGLPIRDFGLTDSNPKSKIQNLKSDLLALLAHPNIASKEHIVRTYDHLVQGRTVQGPLGGVHGDAPTNAAVLQPRHTNTQAIALGCGVNPRYGLIDPYWMALAACDEALRNVVAVGADPYRTALLDNFCWGDPRQPDRLAGLVRAAAGCRDIAQVWSTPFISGKDSLNNEYRDATGTRVPIPPTLLVTALGVVPSIDTTITSELQQPGNLIYLVGLTKNELGGSHYLLLRHEIGVNVPQVDLIQARRTFRTLHLAITLGYVQSCHDLSEGGLGIAAAEMVLGSALGLDLDMATVAAADDAVGDATLLFSESPSRFLVEVRPEDSVAFGALMDGIDVGLIGFVTDDGRLRVDGVGGDEVLDVDAAALRAAWQTFVTDGGTMKHSA